MVYRLFNFVYLSDLTIADSGRWRPGSLDMVYAVDESGLDLKERKTIFNNSLAQNFDKIMYVRGIKQTFEMS